MTTACEPRTASLYYREGSSDKEYHAHLESRGDGFVVNFAYGRRGSALSTGTKTKEPVAYDKALSIFDKLLKSKEAKGYTRGEDGTPFQHTDNDSDRQPSGLLPQLLNVAADSDIARLVADPAWCIQEKLDGRRLILRKSGDIVEAINKLGLLVGVPTALVDAAHRIDGDFTVDGEIIGDRLYAFDLLDCAGLTLRDRPYSDRYRTLIELLADGDEHITAVTAFADHHAKAEQLAALKAAGAEGVVFKRWDARYTVGRPNSGGSQLKHKFVETLSALVTAVNTPRSVGVSLYGDDVLVFVGNVSIPANYEVPPVGAVVEVRYLYAAPALYQPVYLGLRDDVTPAECVMAQVKYKSSFGR